MTQLKTWVFASANDAEEFVEIAVNVLNRNEGIQRNVAKFIAELVFDKLSLPNELNLALGSFKSNIWSGDGTTKVSLALFFDEKANAIAERYNPMLNRYEDNSNRECPAIPYVCCRPEVESARPTIVSPIAAIIR
jgi:hypothetical protein